jgi:Phospholipase_D-nuclease N-terminal/Short C-terminal domain
MSWAAASSYPVLNVLWSIFVFFGLVAFFGLLIVVFSDLFRRDDIGGWGKTGWTVFVIVFPLIGTLAYLIAEGRGMSGRNRRQARTAQRQTDEYLRSVVATDSYRGVEDIARGKELLDRGAITQEEFDEIKRRALV